MNKKGGGAGLGDFIVPIVDLFSIVSIELVELLTKLLIKGFNHMSKKDTHNLEKIERSELLVTNRTNNEDALGYSITQGRIIAMNELDKRKHTLVCGASGFGKTVLLDSLMFEDMRTNKPVIFIDPKGDANSMNQFINLCKLAGREYQVFSEHYKDEGAISLNPVKEGSYTHIADRVHYSFNWSEEHYETLCYRALKKACSYLEDNNQSVSYKSILDKLIEISDPKDKERDFERKDIEGIISRLENIIESDFGDKLKAEGMSFNEIWQGRKCIYIGLPVLGYPKVARSLGRLILGDLAYSVYDAYKNIDSASKNIDHSLGVYIDELSAVITDEFIELLNKCRGVGMELNFAFQSPSDINKLSSDLCEQILENTSNWFILKQRMESGADTFSKAIGTRASVKKTLRVDDEEVQAQGSQREVEELIAHHNIIKNLNQGQGILLRHSPTKVDLINFKYIDPDVVEENVKFLNSSGDSIVSQSTVESTTSTNGANH
jgi:hypothetical protein